MGARRESRRESLAEWYPLLLRYGGLAVTFLFVPIFWALTGRIEPLILGAGITAAGIGEGADAVRELVRSRPPPPSTSAAADRRPSIEE